MAGPWLALFALNVLFIAPGVGLEVSERTSSLLVPSGDLLLLVAVVVLSIRWRHGVWLKRAAVGSGIVLWVYLWDELVARSILYQSPPLYDQAFLLRHLAVLISDLWSWKVGLGMLGIIVATVFLVWLARALLRASVTGIRAQSVRAQLIGGGLLAMVIGLGSAVDSSRETPRRQRLVHWTTPALSTNAAASVRMYRALQRGLTESPYSEYPQQVPLRRKPDIHLLLVESYGRLLITDPEAGPAWREQTQGLERRLREKGWDMVSAFSRAPISGGRSWLAEGTLLTGIYVRFEAVFQHLVADISQTPNLVAYLDTQGYETVLLAPKARPRPGVESVNRYNYDQQIEALDLEYTGPRFGWGIIPDQYSLGFTQEHVLSKIEGPMFFNFHMVSSHAPWQIIPEFQDDWRSLNDAQDTPETQGQFPMATPGEEFMARMRRYQRRKPKYMWMGDADALKIDAYAASIRYDLELRTRYVEGLDRDAVVIIMGDHQPPLLSREDETFDVPVHILARDPALLEEFRERGFVDGLGINSGRDAVIAHEGVFSMMVRALGRCCSEPDTSLVPYLPEGAPGIDDRGRSR
ncbi:MAG: hypothetical protein KUG77_02970 [Nannocystaceae bacterium]|nr:hypothetical protein [Nannocystaceae bacterium]